MDETDYRDIYVTGDDAFDFLQGQLSHDLRLLDERPNLSAAWCNPKGRVIAFLRVRIIDRGYALTLPGELCDSVSKRLTMFRFRAKVDFDDRDAKLSDLGWNGSASDWRRQNLLAGVPDIRTAQSEEFTPHMLNLDLLDALSLDKGCYTGQEIVARTHFRGATKRRMLLFTSAEPVTAGSAVFDGDRKIGDVVNAIDNTLLAVVPIASRDRPLHVENVALEAREMPYPIEQEASARG
ncbi:MAG: folate-binding protein YgfZ [Woeseiaceae bacterium]|nr:folate-binding protein YgfZ [Woeseiaceae bacterium]